MIFTHIYMDIVQLYSIDFKANSYFAPTCVELFLSKIILILKAKNESVFCML